MALIFELGKLQKNLASRPTYPAEAYCNAAECRITLDEEGDKTRNDPVYGGEEGSDERLG